MPLQKLKKTFFKIKANLAHKSHFTLQSSGMLQSMFNLDAGVPLFLRNLAFYGELPNLSWLSAPAQPRSRH